jgi:hypothetical protein
MARRFLQFAPVFAFIPLLFTPEARPSRPTIDWIVPSGYAGWLVIAWNCAEGEPLATFQVTDDTDHYRVPLNTDGIACISDDFPDGGYILGSFTHPDGTNAPVRHGITRGASDTYYLTPGSPVPTPVTTGHVYSVASIGIGDDYALGDDCDLRDFLHRHFGEPNSPVRCEPVYHRTPPEGYIATAEAQRSATPTSNPAR